MTNFRKRNLGPQAFIVSVTVVVLLLLAVEIYLRLFAPFHVAKIGHIDSENALKYGWGYNPYDLMKLQNPDTGDVYANPLNNHGWRDRDRHYDNKANSFRILVLGDSITFGLIVPAEKIYTRILEEKLIQNGYNAEVINISYGGWSTDQELEALLNEGLKYKPHLIIVQFDTNDISTNACMYHVLQGRKKYDDLTEKKPFYYFINEEDKLYKRKNPFYSKERPKTFRDRIKIVIYRVELLKRLYALYLHYKLNGFAYNTGMKTASADSIKSNEYCVSQNQLVQLQMALKLREDSEFYRFLCGYLERPLPYGQLSSAIESQGYSKDKDAILRILEDRTVHQYWSPESYFGVKIDPDSYDWRLFFALIDEIKKHADKINADLAIFNTVEMGCYNWELSWYRVGNDNMSKDNYLKHVSIIKQAMAKKKIGVIENRIPYKRARNDSHPNIEGNKAMAFDIWRYLMMHYKDKLELYRNLAKD